MVVKSSPERLSRFTAYILGAYGRRSVTPDTALRLARLFGTEPEFWLNLQQAHDLWEAMHAPEASNLEEIVPVTG